MPIPQWLIDIQSWILTLSPICTLLILIFWKPLKAFCINVYSHFVSEPDAKNKSEIEQLEDRINKLSEKVEKLVDGREEDKEIYLALLHHEIFQTARQALSKKKITESELENLEELYTPYKKLGGNGTAEKVYNDCKILPIESWNIDKEEK